MLERIKNRRHTVTIGLVGKYVRLHDAYLSVAEALRHAGYECSSRVEIEWIDSETVTEENAAERLGSCDGILIPGGFGNRGIEGARSPQRITREPITCRTSAYASACRSPLSSTQRYVCGAQRRKLGEFDEDSKHKGHRFHARSVERDRKRRNHAPRRISVQNNPRHEDGGML